MSQGKRHTPESLRQEAEVFDAQIRERVAVGHVPDLRRCGHCEWFRNNPWRDEALVRMTYGERAKYVLKRLEKPARILEVGCGPGFLSLELARAGHDVTGLDLSGACVEVAQKTADDGLDAGCSGAVRYLVGNFMEFAGGGFDCVVFSSSLHHFPVQGEVAEKVRELLVSGGLVMFMEPCRERLSEEGAAVWYLAESLLFEAGAFSENVPLCQDRESLEVALEGYMRRGRYRAKDGASVQSCHDMDAGYAEMVGAFRKVFEEVDTEWEYAFFGNLIGGIRLGDRDREAHLARHVKVLDTFLVERGVLPAIGFRWCGRILPEAQQGEM